MARVTVEDCIENVADRFELVALAARRAKDIAAGGMLTVDRDNDKDAVVALREIADLTVDVPTLREELVTNFQRRQAMETFIKDEPEKGDKVTDEVKEEFTEQLMSPEARKSQEDETGNMSFDDENLNVED